MLGAPTSHYHPFSALENYNVSLPSVLKLDEVLGVSSYGLATSHYQGQDANDIMEFRGQGRKTPFKELPPEDGLGCSRASYSRHCLQ